MVIENCRKLDLKKKVLNKCFNILKYGKNNDSLSDCYTISKIFECWLYVTKNCKLFKHLFKRDFTNLQFLYV